MSELNGKVVIDNYTCTHCGWNTKKFRVYCKKCGCRMLRMVTVKDKNEPVLPVKDSIRLYSGFFKVRILHKYGGSCLVEALEDYSDIQKGQTWLTRTTNLELIVKEF